MFISLVSRSLDLNSLWIPIMPICNDWNVRVEVRWMSWLKFELFSWNLIDYRIVWFPFTVWWSPRTSVLLRDHTSSWIDNSHDRIEDLDDHSCIDELFLCNKDIQKRSDREAESNAPSIHVRILYWTRTCTSSKNSQLLVHWDPFWISETLRRIAWYHLECD